MPSSDQRREEGHFRKAEEVMLFIDEAGRRAAQAVAELHKDGAEDYLIKALETSAGAMRAEHSRLMKSVYYPAAASEPMPDAEGEDQERLAM